MKYRIIKAFLVFLLISYPGLSSNENLNSHCAIIEKHGARDKQNNYKTINLDQQTIHENHTREQIFHHNNQVLDNVRSDNDYTLGLIIFIVSILTGGLGVIAPYVIHNRNEKKIEKINADFNKGLDDERINSENTLKAIAQEFQIKVESIIKSHQNELNNLKNLILEQEIKTKLSAQFAKYEKNFISAYNETDLDKKISFFDKASTRLIQDKLNVPKEYVPEINNYLKDIYNSRGTTMLNAGNLHEALKDFSNAIELDKHNAYYYANRAHVKTLLKDLEGALDDCNQALKIDPKNSNAYTNRGNILREQNKNNDAIRDYTKSIEYDINSGEAYHNRAIIYFINKDYENALKDCNNAVRLGIKTSSLFFYKGKINNKLENYSESIIDFDEAYRLGKSDAELFVNRALAKANFNDWKESLLDYNRAIELDSESAETLHARGLVYYNLNNIPAAMNDFNKAIDLKSDDFRPYQGRAILKMHLNDFTQALHDFNKAIELSTDNCSLYYNRALAHQALEHDKEAISDLTVVIEKDGNFAPAYTKRAGSYVKVREIKKALDDYNQSIELRPDFYNSYLERAYFFYSIENYTNALEDTNSAIHLAKHHSNFSSLEISLSNRNGKLLMNGNLHEVLSNLFLIKSELELKLNSEEMAISSCLKSIDYDNNNSTAYRNIANILLTTRRMADALFYCNRGLNIKSDDIHLRCTKAEIYRELGYLEYSLKEFMKVEKLDPSFLTLYTERAKLYNILSTVMKSENMINHYTNLAKSDEKKSIMLNNLNHEK